MSRLAAIFGYARWQARDALPKALIPFGLFLVFAGLPIVVLARRKTLAALQVAGRDQEMVVQMYEQSLSTALVLGAIVLMSGAASLDRERQHVRFLFSRPAPPWQFYLQQLLVATLLFVACTALLPVTFGAVIVAVPVLPVVKSAALYGLFYGALALLLGALLNRDGIAFILIIVVAATLQDLDRSGELTGTLRVLAESLPPVGASNAVRRAWVSGAVAPAADLRLVVAYTVAMIAAALWVIQRRPLVR